MTPHEQTIAELRDEVARLQQLLAGPPSPIPSAIDRTLAEQWHRTFDAVPDLIALIDSGHRIIRINRALATALGVTPDEAVGRPCYQIIHGIGAPHPHCPHTRLLADGREHHAEVYAGQLGGYFNFTVSPLCDDAGRICGSVHVARDISMLKKTERELRESEERYRSLVETTADWIWELDDAGRYTYASPQVRELLGYAPEETIGRTPFDFMPEDEAWRVGEIFADIAGERRPFSALENVIRHRDGRLITLETSGTPVFDEAGTFRGYRGIARDITARKLEREILLARLRLLGYSFTHSLGELLTAMLDEVEEITGSTIGFCHFLAQDQKSLSLQAWSTRTRDGYCASVNADTHYDISRAGVWADCVRERRPIIHNDYAALPGRKGLPEGHAGVVRELVVPVFRENRIVVIVGVGNKPTDYLDQDIDTVELLADLVWDLAGHKIVTDLLDVKEQALRDSETLFRTLCEAAPIGIFRTDSALNPIYRNPRWYEIFGESAPQPADVSCLTVIHPDDRERARTAWLRATTTGSPYACEYRVISTRERWVKSLASPIRNPDGTVTGYVGTVEDITDARQAREEQHKHQKLESLGVLAGGIAHDFNNILTAIVGSISLAQFQRENPEEVSQLLADAEHAALQAKNLTQQLLTFARGGEPVKQALASENILTKSVSFACRGSAVRCVFSLEEGLWPVEADEGQLSQVFQNLTINAVQAMPDGGTLTISARNLPPPDGGDRFIEIAVADTGTGIAAKHLRTIFDPYFTTKPQGSGLGLATCYSIVTQHGGTITVTSRVGEGSTFTITLPASDSETVPAPDKEREVTSGTGRVLVMDDERSVRKIAQAMLQSLGYEVECAIDGDEALELYRDRLEEGSPFDVTIMDLTIPGGRGGKETVREILRIDPAARVIVSSGYSADSVLADYRDHGFCAILGKPYRLQELGQVLQELLAPPP